jgi:uncharacterized metal-binding protein
MTDYKIWELWIWDEDDKKHIEYTKQTNLDEVIRFCEMRGFKKYSIFNSDLKNVANNGERVLLGLD